MKTHLEREALLGLRADLLKLRTETNEIARRVHVIQHDQDVIDLSLKFSHAMNGKQIFVCLAALLGCVHMIVDELATAIEIDTIDTKTSCEPPSKS